MKAPRCITIDFETEKIQNRPDYPPEPGGVSIKWPADRKPVYYAWGHDSDNNCSKNDARRVLMKAFTSDLPLLGFNMKFDLAVAYEKMDLPEVPWERVHDEMFVAFLLDPHTRDLRLKSLAEKLLHMPPEERDVVFEWLVEHKVITRAQKSKVGEHFMRAPGGLVGVYAGGDVIRTVKLFEKGFPEVVARGMLDSYNRERRVQPIFYRNEREGIPVDVARLRREIPIHEKLLERADAWLRKALKAPGLNIDADADMAEALDRADMITEWTMTSGGQHGTPQKSVSKKNLTPDKFRDKRVSSVYGYRNRMATCLRMFEVSWLEQAERSGGRIFANWNTVRQPKGNKSGGTRTGRPSCNDPNLLNLTKDWMDKKDGYVHPKFGQFDILPLVRSYVLPDKGGVFGHRDYNQQELRILAHFEDDMLMQIYKDNPRADVHQIVTGLLASAGYIFERRAVKIINFGIIYGKGAGLFAEELSAAEQRDVTVNEARALLKAHGVALPGIPALNKAIKELVKAGEPIRTWGGREYFVEEPTLYKGKLIHWDYKLLNYLCQGSAADATKEALIRYDSVKKNGRFLVTVYDEIDISAPRGAMKAEMKILKDAMESIELDVPLLSDGATGPNWSDLTTFKDAA